MNTLRLLSLGLAITAALLLVSGSLGFTSTTADRGVSVSVADDEDAFVGYDAHDATEVETGEELKIIEITNQFNQNISVTDVSLDEDSGIALDVSSTPDEISPGETATVKAKVNSCESGNSGDVATEVTVHGDSVSATLFDGDDSKTVERSLRIECVTPEEQVQNISYNGQGNAEIIGPEQSVTATFFVTNNKNEDVIQVTGEFEPETKLKNQLKSKFDISTGGIQIRCGKIGGEEDPNDNFPDSDLCSAE